MAEYVLPPPLHELLPTLLAHLPTAFASPQPPPTLLPLLSPILRQRVQLFSADGASTWLSLLCWSSEDAELLVDQVQRMELEYHPVTGEIELEDAEIVGYRKLDAETLRAKVNLGIRGIDVMYLWCRGDKPQWLVAEVLPASVEDGWYSSIEEASEHQGEAPNGHRDIRVDDDDDDDYWKQYDNPSETPAMKRSPAPQVRPHDDREAEDAYFARYGSVQPAMDAEDPDEPTTNDHTNGDLAGHNRHISHKHEPSDGFVKVLHEPRPISPASSKSSLAEVIEAKAASQLQHETGVRQHISTSIKSLFRLAKISGIQRDEFTEMVQTELEVLSLIEDDA